MAVYLDRVTKDRVTKDGVTKDRVTKDRKQLMENTVLHRQPA